MKTKVGILLIAVFALLLPQVLFAQGEKPIQISLINPVQIFKAEESVKGFRLNLIYGQNANVTGLDWGVIGRTTGDAKAWQIGVINHVDGAFQGWATGAVNYAGGDQKGIVFGIANISKGTQRGLHIGLINVAENLNGIQIGLINVNKGAAKIKFFPVINFSFNN